MARRRDEPTVSRLREGARLDRRPFVWCRDTRLDPAQHDKCPGSVVNGLIVCPCEACAHWDRLAFGET